MADDPAAVPAPSPRLETITAAGVMVYAPTGSVLFLKRGEGGDFPGYWGFPGGKQEDGETLAQAAIRETEEECGLIIPELGAPLCRRVRDGADFTTFPHEVAAEFIPTLSDESTAYAWAPADQPPQPLHPGCAVALARPKMNELDVARAMASGDLSSPQRYESMALYDMRLTGTGVSYRAGLEEHVYRSPDVYLNQDFLDRCAGLPVIWVHPPKNTLDSKEYAKRVIGAVMLAYIKGDEVWAICRVYDDEAIEKMEANQLSTSPAVVFRDPSVNTKLETEDGAKLLIEGDPTFIDHLAVVPLGVWDKGGEPSGIRADAQIGAKTMAEENKDIEKKADGADCPDKKADAGTENIKDLIVGLADSVNKRFDALASRMDSFESEKKADAARKDNEGKNGDDEDVKAKEIAADKARKDGDDKDKEELEKAKADADRARADAAGLSKRLADLESRLPKPLTDTDYHAMADTQARADSVYNALGKRAAPRPLDGETPDLYARRIAGQLKAHSKNFKDMDLNSLNPEAFAKIESMIYADAASYAARPDDIGDFELRPVSRTTDSGHKVTEFYGKTSFVSGMKPPVRIVERTDPRDFRH